MNAELKLGPIGQISRMVKDIQRAEEWMAFFKDPESQPLAIMSLVAPQ